MVIFLVILHIIVSLFLVGVVLLQQGKSADLAKTFGGQGSQTAFGPRGAANLPTKLTTYSSIIFMLFSTALTTWTNATDRITCPAKLLHGSFLRITQAEYNQINSLTLP